MSNTLRDMVQGDVEKNLEKLHESVAKFNDDLRYLRGVDLDLLDDSQLGFVKQLTDQAAGLALMQVMLEIMVVKKLKGEA